MDSSVVQQFGNTLSPLNRDVRCLTIILMDNNDFDGNKTFITTLSVSDPTVTVKNNITNVIIVDDDG